MSLNSEGHDPSTSTTLESIMDPPMSPVKPAISYAALIAQALMDSPDGRLALPEIYSWIQNHFEYYRVASPAWKNSIRHNLSMNRAFCKAEPPPNAQFKCSYWQFAVPTKVKIGSKGKATVSTTGARGRSKSLSVSEGRVNKASKERRQSVDSTMAIRPRPEWLNQGSVFDGRTAINSLDLNYLLPPDVSSTSNSTVILLSSSSESPSRDDLLMEPVRDCPKGSWTPPPGDLQDLFLYSRDPLIPISNDRSPMLK